MATEDLDALDRTVLVDGFGDDMTDTTLVELFSRFGSLDEVSLDADNSAGFAMIIFKRPEDACHAVQVLDGRQHKGLTVSVQLASKFCDQDLKPKPKSPEDQPKQPQNQPKLQDPHDHQPPPPPPPKSSSTPATAEPRVTDLDEDNYQLTPPNKLQTQIFIGNLGSSGTEEELTEAFSAFGPVVRIFLSPERSGFAFVTFRDAKDAKAALKMDGKIVCGRRIRVELARTRWYRGGGGSQPNPNNKLYIGNIGPTATEKGLLEIFGKYGVIREICIRNFGLAEAAFITFAKISAAQAAIEGEHGKSHFGRLLVVELARPPGSAPIRWSDPDCRLFVGGVPDDDPERKAQLEAVFGQYGPLVEVWIAQNPPGHAFITFKDPEHARAALELNGSLICNRRISVELSRTGRGGDRFGPGSVLVPPPPSSSSSSTTIFTGPPKKPATATTTVDDLLGPLEPAVSKLTANPLIPSPSLPTKQLDIVSAARPPQLIQIVPASPPSSETRTPLGHHWTRPLTEETNQTQLTTPSSRSTPQPDLQNLRSSSTALHVTGFDASHIVPEDLKQIFGPYGRLQDVFLVHNPVQLALVIFDKAEAAQKALDLDKTFLRGHRISVTLAQMDFLYGSESRRGLSKPTNNPASYALNDLPNELLTRLLNHAYIPLQQRIHLRAVSRRFQSVIEESLKKQTRLGIFADRTQATSPGTDLIVPQAVFDLNFIDTIATLFPIVMDLTVEVPSTQHLHLLHVLFAPYMATLMRLTIYLNGPHLSISQLYPLLAEFPYLLQLTIQCDRRYHAAVEANRSQLPAQVNFRVVE